ncbi:MAG: 3-phenylpropionate/cinnamic acid dioxygenase subunit beta [Candidatus Binatus sp.]|uniref:aromatic-ring-hydroxylating dioxygenase subunit beta n=1 Tax=Candidatus Binatus sp. TaxID=2811406 RepID=UPI0027292DE1|nr:3-phenylpropionate/cinnamic acid dioxygenase subunit beta [Candidatus Binatus sp.]MDO8434748.1 3-phenylpropionate/cinnamic acid dioxygenase subunit beta [Candidatus Binatus sp.]
MSAGVATQPKSQAASAEKVTPELQQEIEQFLYHESRILDDRRYEEWFELLASDLHYFMPTRYNRLRRESDKEFSAANEAAFFDEDRASIAMRIRRLNTGMAWAEDPPSRTRHMVSNVVIKPRGNDEYEVDCYYLLYRSRLEREVETFVGMRHDVLRRANNSAGFELARRTIILDQTILLARNLSFFF